MYYFLSYNVLFHFKTWICLASKKLGAQHTYISTYGMAAFSLNTFNKGDQMLCVFHGLFCIPTKCPCFGCDRRWFILKPSPAALTQRRQGTVKRQAICARQVGWRSALSGGDCNFLVTVFSSHPVTLKSYGSNPYAFAILFCSCILHSIMPSSFSLSKKHITLLDYIGSRVSMKCKMLISLYAFQTYVKISDPVAASAKLHALKSKRDSFRAFLNN